MISFFLGVIIGFIFGMHIASLKSQVRKLWAELEDRDKRVMPAVSMGVYDKTDTPNHTDTPSQYGIAEVKTPQLLAWEEEERIKKGIENV